MNSLTTDEAVLSQNIPIRKEETSDQKITVYHFLITGELEKTINPREKT
jgi:hypothetical protein